MESSPWNRCWIKCVGPMWPKKLPTVPFEGAAMCCYVLLCAAMCCFPLLYPGHEQQVLDLGRGTKVACDRSGFIQIISTKVLNFALKSIVSWFMNIHDIYWILYDFIGISRLKFFVSLMLCGLLQPVSVRLYTVQLSNANGVAEDVRRFLQPILAHSISRDSHELSLSEFEPSLRQDR